MKLGGAAPARRVSKISPESIIAGVVLCFTVTLLSAGALTVVLLLTPMTEKALPPVVTVVGALSIFAGGFASGRKSGGLGWVHGGVAGVVYTVACYLLGLLVFPELMPVSLLARRLVLGFGIGLVGGIAGVNF
ncbi:MAG: TIGR04086 family membrane protein [Ignavibacteriales bacterium]